MGFSKSFFFVGANPKKKCASYGMGFSFFCGCQPKKQGASYGMSISKPYFFWGVPTQKIGASYGIEISKPYYYLVVFPRIGASYGMESALFLFEGLPKKRLPFLVSESNVRHYRLAFCPAPLAAQQHVLWPPAGRFPGDFLLLWPPAGRFPGDFLLVSERKVRHYRLALNVSRRPRLPLNPARRPWRPSSMSFGHLPGAFLEIFFLKPEENLQESARQVAKAEENLQESARQVAKAHAAGPPRAPGRV